MYILDLLDNGLLTDMKIQSLTAIIQSKYTNTGKHLSYMQKNHQESKVTQRTNVSANHRERKLSFVNPVPSGRAKY